LNAPNHLSVSNKRKYVIPEDKAEKMREWLEQQPGMPAEGTKVARALHEQFGLPVERLRKSEFVRAYVLELKAADLVCEEDKLDPAPKKLSDFVKLPEAEEADTGLRYEETKNAATLEGKRVTSLEHLLELAQVDRDVWEVERWVANKWEVGAKNAQKEIAVTPLYQIKAWLKRKSAADFDYQKVREADLNFIKQYAPVYHTIKREPITDGHLMLIDPADTHFGKYATRAETGELYNLGIAEARCKEGVTKLLEKAAGFPIDKFALQLGNDMLHVDNTRRTTTSGTPQDTDGMWYEAYQVAKRTQIEIIEGLLLIADVHCVFNPSNHDYAMGYALFDSIVTHFAKAKNFTADGSMAHRKYLSYGNSLIGTTHGDGAKLDKLVYLMAHEAPEHWGKAVHRNWYTHHVHNMESIKFKSGKDFIGCTLESMRTQATADSWHAKEGWKGAPKSMAAFIHSKQGGQEARLFHTFKSEDKSTMPVFNLAKAS